MSSPMIRVDGLRKRYDDVEALRGVSFEVPKGQVVGFLGPNGAGKSTTMKILTGFVEPSAGRVEVAGIDVRENPVEARRHIGYLPENNPLYDDMMVVEYLEYAADVRDVPRSERSARIAGAIERCGLGPVRGKDIRELSKGFRQRVGLAQAILHGPELLILDEPTTGLDPNQILEIRDLIRELGEDNTVLMSTHILPEVQATSSRVLIISDGQVVADDAPEALTRQGSSIDVVVASKGASLDAGDVERALSGIGGVLDLAQQNTPEPDAVAFTLKCGEDDPRRALFDEVVARDWVLLRLERSQISLEETFRRLTTADTAPDASKSAA